MLCMVPSPSRELAVSLRITLSVSYRMPDALAGVRYYEYGQNKNEQAAKAYWDKIKK